MDTRVSLPFGDGVYEFWLPMPRVIAAEREMGRMDAEGVKRPHSLFAVFHDIGSHVGSVTGDEIVLIGPSPAHLADARTVIRNGLVGGGSGLVGGEVVAVTDAMADELVETYCYPARPAMHDLALAWRILQAAIYGIETGSKKKDATPESRKPSPKAS